MKMKIVVRMILDDDDDGVLRVMLGFLFFERERGRERERYDWFFEILNFFFDEVRNRRSVR
jgi:hypothetical protein